MAKNSLQQSAVLSLLIFGRMVWFGNQCPRDTQDLDMSIFLWILNKDYCKSRYPQFYTSTCGFTCHWDYHARSISSMFPKDHFWNFTCLDLTFKTSSFYVFMLKWFFFNEKSMHFKQCYNRKYMLPCLVLYHLLSAFIYVISLDIKNKPISYQGQRYIKTI